MSQNSNDRPIVFYGASELGRDALSVVEGLEKAGRAVQVIGFVDDGAAADGVTEIAGLPILGGGAWLSSRGSEVQCLITIGKPSIRRFLAARLQEWGVSSPTLIHPTAVMGRTVHVGQGTLIMAGVTTTVETVIGDHVVINPRCSIAHDVRIGDFAYLSPGVDLAGRVTIGQAAYLGIASTVLPSRSIGRDAFLGAGAVAVKDVPDGETHAGVPARRLEG